MFSNALPKFCGQSLRYKYKINKWKYSKNSSRNVAKTELLCKRKYTHGHSVKTCFAQAMTICSKPRALKLCIKSLYYVIVIAAFRIWAFTGFWLFFTGVWLVFHSFYWFFTGFSLVELESNAKMRRIRGHWLLNSRPLACNSCENNNAILNTLKKCKEKCKFQEIPALYFLQSDYSIYLLN